MKPTILIFSRPIQSGKTTELKRTFSGNPNVGGFLTPDMEDRRMIYDFAKDEYHPFEAARQDPSPVQTIGKFRFLESGFEAAKRLFAIEKDFLIVDEVGRLEVVEDKGLEPELSVLIDGYLSGKRKGNLLLVIRDSLLQAAVRKYGLKDVPVLCSLAEIALPGSAGETHPGNRI